MTISTRPETRDHVIHRADTTATTSRRILQWALALLMILSVTVSRTARADADDPSDPIARERLSQGNKLYRLREFAKAIDEYKAGVLAEDAPVFAFNLGQCYRQLSTDDAAAIWHFERYLSRGHPTAERRV